MENQKCKGTRDLLPRDMHRFRHIEDVFRRCCHSWGYQEVRTPLLEYLHLFTSAGTLAPDMLRKVYSFLDWDGWSGERVVLRPEGTIPVARLYIENLADKELARLFYVTNIFTFEATGKEDRERWQCGVEFLGGEAPTADAEVIMLACEVLRQLNFPDLKLRLAHAGLLKSLIRELKLAPGEESKVLYEVLEKGGKALTRVKPLSPELNIFISLLFDLKGKTTGFLENLMALSSRTLPGLKTVFEEFIRVTEILDTLGYEYEIDIISVSDFEYYTGVCFQFFVGGERVGSGGRYNNLIRLMGGGDISASGFALYIDKLMPLLPWEIPRWGKQAVLIVDELMTPEGIKTSFELAQSLRNAGYIAEIDFQKQRTTEMRWIIKYQKQGHSPFLLIDQFTGEEIEVISIEQVLSMLKRVS